MTTQRQTSAVVGLGVDARPAEQGARVWRRAGKSIRDDAAQTSKSVLHLDRSLGGAGKGIDSLGVRTRRLGDIFAPVGRGLRSFRDGVLSIISPARLAALAIGALTIAASAVGPAMAVQQWSTYTNRMAAVQAVTRGAAGDMDRLAAQARELGATTRFSANDAAEGMEFLGRAGFGVSKIIGAMPGLLDLAAAAQLDLGRAADITSNVVSGFGLAASEAGRIADALAAAAANANTDVGMMGEAMKYAGPVAAALGVSMEHAAAAVGTLSNAGIQASMAGTSLRRILSELAAPSAASEKAFKRLGLSLEDLDPRTNRFADIIGRLAAANLEAADAFEIFGDRGAPAILALTSTHGDLVRLTDVLDNSAGTARRMADVMNNTLSGSMAELDSVTEEISLRFADQLGPAVREVVDDFREFLGANQDIGTSLGKVAAAAVRGLADGIKFLASMAHLVVPALTGIATAWAVLKLAPATLAVIAWGKAWYAATAMLRLSTIALGGVSAAVAGVRAGIAALTATMAANPLTVWAVALGVLVGGLVLATRRYRETQRAAEEYHRELREGRVDVEGASDALDGLIDRLERERDLRAGFDRDAQIKTWRLEELEKVATRMREALEIGNLDSYQKAIEGAERLGIALSGLDQQSAYQQVTKTIALLRLEIERSGTAAEASASRVRSLEEELSSSTEQRLQIARNRIVEYRAVLADAALAAEVTRREINSVMEAGADRNDTFIRLTELRQELERIEDRAAAARSGLSLVMGEAREMERQIYDRARELYQQGRGEEARGLLSLIYSPEQLAEMDALEAAIDAVVERDNARFRQLKKNREEAAEGWTKLLAALAEERAALEAQLESWEKWGRVTDEVIARNEASAAVARAGAALTEANIGRVAAEILQNMRLKESLTQLEEASEAWVEQLQQQAEWVAERNKGMTDHLATQEEVLQQLRELYDAERRGAAAVREHNIQWETRRRLQEREISGDTPEAALIEAQVREEYRLKEAVDQVREARAAREKALEDETKRQRDQYDELYIKPIETAITRTQGMAADALGDVLTSWMGDSKNVFEQILEMWIRTLAEMAIAAATQRFVVNVETRQQLQGPTQDGGNLSGGGGFWGGMFGNNATGWMNTAAMVAGAMASANNVGYAAAGAIVGAVVGGFIGGAVTGGLFTAAGAQIGATIGAWLGSMIKTGSPEFYGALQVELGKVKIGPSELGGGWRQVAAGFANDLQEAMQGILDTIGAQLVGMEGGIDLKLKDEKLSVFVDGLEYRFKKDIEGGIAFALVEALKRADLEGASETFIKILKTTTANTLEELKAALDFGKWYEALRLGESASQLNDILNQYGAAIRKALEAGLDLGPINEWLGRSLQEYRNNILGIQETEEERRKRQQQEYNAWVQMVEAENLAKEADLLIKRANLEAEIAVIRARLKVDEGHLQWKREMLDAELAINTAEWELLHAKLQALAAVEAALAVVQGILANLPDLITDQDLQDAARRNRNRDKKNEREQKERDTVALRDTLRGYHEAGLTDLQRELLELGRRFADLRAEAERLGVSTEEAAAAEAAARQQLLDRVRADLAPLLEDWGKSDAVLALDEIRRRFGDLRASSAELGLSLEELALAEERANREVRDQLVDGLSDYLPDTVAIRREMDRVLQIFEDMRANAEALGLTEMEVTYYQQQTLAAMTHNLLSSLSQYLDDEQLAAELAQAKWDLEIQGYYLQLELMHQMLGLSQEVYDRIKALIDIVAENGPPAPNAGGAGGGGGGFSGGSSGPNWWEQQADALARVREVIAGWATGGNAAAEELGRMKTALDEAKEAIRLYSLEQRQRGITQQLQAAYDAAVAEFWDRTLEPWERGADTLQGRMREITDQFAELMDAARQHGGDLARIQAAQARAIQELMDEVLDPLRDWGTDAALGEHSSLTGEEKVARARREVQDLGARALAGDLDAFQALPDAFDRLLGLARDAYGSSGGYTRERDFVEALRAQLLGIFGGVDPASLGLGALPLGAVPVAAANDDEPAAVLTFTSTVKVDAEETVQELKKLREQTVANTNRMVKALEAATTAITGAVRQAAPAGRR